MNIFSWFKYFCRRTLSLAFDWFNRRKHEASAIAHPTRGKQECLANAFHFVCHHTFHAINSGNYSEVFKGKFTKVILIPQQSGEF